MLGNGAWQWTVKPFAPQVRRLERLSDGPHEEAGQRESAAAETDRRFVTEGRDCQGGASKKAVMPSCRKEKAKRAIREKAICGTMACQDFQVGELCYRYHPKCKLRMMWSPTGWFVKLRTPGIEALICAPCISETSGTIIGITGRCVGVTGNKNSICRLPQKSTFLRKNLRLQASTRESPKTGHWAYQLTAQLLFWLLNIINDFNQE